MQQACSQSPDPYRAEYRLSGLGDGSGPNDAHLRITGSFFPSLSAHFQIEITKWRHLHSKGGFVEFVFALKTFGSKWGHIKLKCFCIVRKVITRPACSIEREFQDSQDNAEKPFVEKKKKKKIVYRMVENLPAIDPTRD